MESNIIPQNKLKIMLKKVQQRIDDVKKEFFSIRQFTSMGELGEIEIYKKFGGVLKSENIIINDNGTQYTLKSIKIYDKNVKDKLLYDITYGHNGISITIGDDPNRVGIYYVKFLDFNCESLREVVFNRKCIDRLENYRLKIIDNDNIESEIMFTERSDRSLLNKIFGFPIKIFQRMFWSI